ncbi:hypothetical protein Anas_13056 [Armadillidium nasatum]|uniref:Uncharacterized protein n=1 Tax=Armadillidium nasatum TaxID=96803 RepID=A0A5N5SQV6_9CRUS|nr:hypothetical protein Anas_13056 [Armadillidium nasatum]
MTLHFPIPHEIINRFDKVISIVFNSLKEGTFTSVGITLSFSSGYRIPTIFDILPILSLSSSSSLPFLLNTPPEKGTKKKKKKMVEEIRVVDFSRAASAN